MCQIYQFRTAALGRWFAVFLLLAIAALSVQAQVSGVVYRDFNLDGTRTFNANSLTATITNIVPIETGVANIRVRAFVDLSRTPISTRTSDNGEFSFGADQIPAGKPVRIEFGELTSGDFEAPFGSGNGTRVQFITAGASAMAIQVGLNYPSDYCQDVQKGIRIVTPCYVNGNSNETAGVDPTNQAATAASIVGFPYEASGMTSPTNFSLTYLATAGQTGAVWGLAYQRRTKQLFSAANLKRHASYGPLGPGGIYATNMTTNTTTSFLDVQTIGIDVGNDSHSGLQANKLLPSIDPGPMQDVGKKSFGGMDMSEDDKTLYMVNLNDRRIYGVFIDSPARTPTAADVKSWAIPNPGCSNGDFRPWALKMYRGQLYVGVICSAETSQQQADLSATIYRFDLTQANPTFETVLQFPLDFRRGPADNTADCLQYDHWLPWTDKWPTPCGNAANPAKSFFVMYPQPLLVDMEFDEQGSMMIGFLDRFGSMSGDQNLDPQGNGAYTDGNGSQKNFDGFAGGDLLRAYNNNGVLELEKNGKSGPYTGSGVGNNEGPVDASGLGGEFFGLDYWIFRGNIAHSEVTNGALTLVPGYNEVISSSFDPITDEFKAGGLKAFNIRTGENTRNFVVYRQLPGSFGKASGLGDSKALCDPAPVEIGNRVWFDDNRDGIQDAYEPGVDGITLTLHDMEDDGNVVGTQITKNGGQYYFNNTTVPTGIKFNHKYEVRMSMDQLPLLDITLGGTRPISSFTAATGGGGAGGRLAAPRSANGRAAAAADRSYTISPMNQTDGNDDVNQRDCDATVAGGSAVIALTTGSFGENNFTFDLSMFSCPILVPQKETINLCSDAKLDAVVANGLHLAKTDQVQFVLFSSPQSGTAMYSGGTVLGTVSASAVSASAVSSTALSALATTTADPLLQVILQNPAINTTNNTAVPTRQYIYAIVFPTPADPNCRQAGETELIISPSLKAQATGGALTCSVTSATLTGQVLYGDDTPVASTSSLFTWTGPGSFTSNQQNPGVSVVGNYTLTVGDGTCPASLSTAIAQVTSNTATPALSASVTVAKICPACAATLEAVTSATAVSWSGINGFSATTKIIQVTEPGVYAVFATDTNGCVAMADVRLNAFECSEPACLPIVISRLK